jgi:hypothetical protein
MQHGIIIRWFNELCEMHRLLPLDTWEMRRS